jgi:hypothetical protein
MSEKYLHGILFKIICFALASFSIYCAIVRFKNPDLTETELFLKIFYME